MENKVKLVLVRWLDSRQPLSSWIHLDSLPDIKPVECVSVGWLIRNDKDVKVLAPNMGDVDSEDNIQTAGIMAITTCSVIEIIGLKETRKCRLIK